MVLGTTQPLLYRATTSTHFFDPILPTTSSTRFWNITMSTLDTTTIDLVRSSWALVAPGKTAVATLFYRHLLTLDPALKPLFSGDMTVQGETLMSMIGAALTLLDRRAAAAGAAQPRRTPPWLRGARRSPQRGRAGAAADAAGWPGRRFHRQRAGRPDIGL